MSKDSILVHLPALRRYARALTGDAWSADDLVQDTLERACSRWRLWLAGSHLRPWLFTIMHNLFVSQVRQDQRRQALVPTVDIDEVHLSLQETDTPIELRLDVQRCLLQLPAEQRAILLLVTVEGMSYAEVASVTQVPLGTVMSRLARAREKMRDLLSAPASAPQSTPLLKRMK